MTDVVDSLSAVFEMEHRGAHVEVNVAASSTLARQIEFGAAADLFISADTLWAAHVVNRVDSSVSYELPYSTRLVGYAGGGAGLQTYADLLSAERLAIADPGHVPAGRYAQALLECSGDWEGVRSRIVPTANVRAALGAAATGAASAAIVYETDLMSLPKAAGRIIDLPVECAPRITYDMVVLKTGKSGVVDSFAGYVLSERSKDVWTHFGFVPARSE